MLDEFYTSQSVAVTLLKNQIDSNMISHAYLFDDNSSGESLKIAYSFVKSILCLDKEHCSSDNKCKICSLIDNGNYPELKIIRPDGMYIKKSQLLELQEDFSKSSIYGNKKIYIIIDADKMKAESANAILKFLEEPSSSIIAILITNNFNNMLPTIISRCQLIRLNNNNGNSNSIYDEMCLNFIKSVNKDKYDSFLKEKELFFDLIDYKNKDNVILFIDTLIDIYYDILGIVSGKENINYSKYYDELFNISKTMNLEYLIRVIQFLINARDSVKFNVNINLLLDNIIFNIGGNCEYSRC